ncbi:MAG: DnaJ domain-containing protein [Myxococcaceae bacterium]
MFSGIGRAAKIEDLLSRSGLDEPKAIAVLLALRAKGAITPARVTAAQPHKQIDAALAEEVDIPPERKKEILDLDRALDGLNYFEMLGLPPGARPDEVKKAYYEASRRYHPDRFFGRNLGSFRGRVERIFRKISEAEQTLTDEKKREAYLKLHPDLAAPPEPAPAPRSAEEEQRDAERRSRLSRHPYLMKNARLNEMVATAKKHLESGEAGLALSDLHLALQIDNRHKEALALQAEARKVHESNRAAAELKRAAELEKAGDSKAACSSYRLAAGIDPKSARAAYKAAELMVALGEDPKEIRVYAQRAVDLEPKNADHQALLGVVFKEAGMDKLAAKHFEEALKLNHNHAEAKKHVKKGRWPF